MSIVNFSLTVPLIDHHCHGIVRDDLSRSEFELLATESDWKEPEGMTIFDSPFGVTVRAECSSLLDLPRHSSAEDYWARRSELGQQEVVSRLMQNTGIETLIIDTGFRSTSLLDLSEMSSVTGADSFEIVRLESVAESLVGKTNADSFEEDYRAELNRRATHAVGFKSIIAYRYGLDFDPTKPTAAQVREAASDWLAAQDLVKPPLKHPTRPVLSEHGEVQDPFKPRLDHPVLLRFVLWEAVLHRKPIQFHVGYGDSDIILHRCDPTQMTGFIKATVHSGIEIMLLHCYPFIREAGFLAQVYPHVWLDTGAAINYTGPSSQELIRQSLELAPFGKVLFSSDAFGLPELYYCGSLLWRRGVGEIFGEWVDQNRMGIDDAHRYLLWFAQGNAQRAYNLAPH
jgi:hypothetical protein